MMRVAWRTLHVRPVGQCAEADVELRVLQNVGARRRGAEENSTLAVLKPRLGVRRAAAVVIHLGLLPLRQLGDVPHDQPIVDRQRRVEPAEAVGFGGDRHVVQRREILHVDPRRPVRGEPARHAGDAQTLRGRTDLRPRLRRDLRIEPGFAEQFLVVIEDRRRRIERQRQHVAGEIGVVAGDGRQIRRRRERFGFVAHQVVDRIDRALRRHHRRGGDLVDLDDRRLRARAKGEDRSAHGFRVAALVDGNDTIGLLRRIEVAASFSSCRPSSPDIACHQRISVAARSG